MKTHRTHRFLAAFGVAAALVAYQRPCEVHDRDRNVARAHLLRQTCTAADLSGTWGTNGLGHEGTSLTLTRTGPITYRVTFASSGCLGSEAAQCSATYRDGVLTFDRPVTEYDGESYRRMRTLQTDLGVRLISEPAVDRSLDMAMEVADVIRQHPEERAFFTRMYLDSWTLEDRSRRGWAIPSGTPGQLKQPTPKGHPAFGKHRKGAPFTQPATVSRRAVYRPWRSLSGLL